MLKSLAKSDKGKTIISIIVGLGLAALFRKVCNDRDCIIIKGPPIEEVTVAFILLTANATNIKQKAQVVKIKINFFFYSFFYK